ncbi:hypothetical protein QQ045_014223 [Rhodiola kirilowii]
MAMAMAMELVWDVMKMKTTRTEDEVDDHVHLRVMGPSYREPLNPPLLRSNVDGEVETLTQVLKNFTEIRCLKIEFPSWEETIDDYGMLRKWKADFGSNFEKYASNIIKSAGGVGVASVGGDGIESYHFDSCVFANRIWTSASAKIYQLHPIIVEHSTLESLVLTDAVGKGISCMNSSQLEEFRLKPLPPPLLL